MGNLRLIVALPVVGFAVAACSQNDTDDSKNTVDRQSPTPVTSSATEKSPVEREPAIEDPPELPEHTVERSALAMKEGQRVQINVQGDIEAAECSRLIDRYRAEGAPDGQISVRKPTADGTLFPYCIENFDGREVTFNEGMF